MSILSADEADSIRYEIEGLRAEIVRLRTLNAAPSKFELELQAEIERLRTENKRLRDEADSDAPK